MKTRFISFIFLISMFCASASAEIIGQDAEYKDGDTVLQGYLAYDADIPGKRPAVIVVHEWKGLDEYAKSRARQLAELGYIGFAADIYGKGVRPQSHEEAGQVAGAYRKDRKLTRERAKAAMDFLKKQEQIVDAEKIAAIGYCFGGMTVLEMARAGFDVKGVASFHGALGTPEPAEPGKIKAKVAVFHGADDKYIPAEDVAAFKEEMSKAGADMRFVEYPGAVHSFTVPDAGDDKSSGRAYDKQADAKSWDALKDFLKEIFSA